MLKRMNLPARGILERFESAVWCPIDILYVNRAAETPSLCRIEYSGAAFTNAYYHTHARDT